MCHWQIIGCRVWRGVPDHHILVIRIGAQLGFLLRQHLSAQVIRHLQCVRRGLPWAAITGIAINTPGDLRQWRRRWFVVSGSPCDPAINKHLVCVNGDFHADQRTGIDGHGVVDDPLCNGIGQTVRMADGDIFREMMSFSFHGYSVVDSGRCSMCWAIGSSSRDTSSPINPT